VLVTQGETALIQGDYALAESIYSSALTENANPALSGYIYYGRGAARLGLNEYDLALDDLNRAIALEPTQIKAYFARR